MAVAFIFEAEHFDAGDYDAVMKELAGTVDETSGPAGLVAHMGGARDGGGWRVIDVWESADAADAFYGSDAFGPVRAGTADANLSMTPWPLHRLDAYGVVHQRD